MTEQSADLELRLSVAWSELARVDEFDYRVVNRDNCLDQTVADIDAIIAAEKCRVRPRIVELL